MTHSVGILLHGHQLESYRRAERWLQASRAAVGTLDAVQQRNVVLFEEQPDLFQSLLEVTGRGSEDPSNLYDWDFWNAP